MNKFIITLLILIITICILKGNIETFKTTTWGFGMFEIPFFSITREIKDK